MDRKKLIAEVANHAGVDQTRTRKVIESFVEVTSQAMASGDYVHIKGFGRFYPKYRQKKLAKNPHTGQEYYLGGKYYPTFKAGITLKERVFAGSEQILGDNK